MVAGGRDVVVRELDLEGGHPVHRAGRGTDLGREVRQRRQIVPEDRGGIGEPVTGQLHPVSGVTCEPDDDVVPLLDGLGHRTGWPGGHTLLLVADGVAFDV